MFTYPVFVSIAMAGAGLSQPRLLASVVSATVGFVHVPFILRENMSTELLSFRIDHQTATLSGPPPQMRRLVAHTLVSPVRGPALMSAAGASEGYEMSDQTTTGFSQAVAINAIPRSRARTTLPWRANTELPSSSHA